MMKQIVSNVFIIFLLSTTSLYGQMLDVSELYKNNEYFFPDFKYICEDDGFTNQRINCLLQDHKDFVWIGTVEGGLFRYDGYEFESFHYDPADPYSLAGEEVFFVFEDSRKLLWVGTNNALSVYDPVRKGFIKIVIPKDDSTNSGIRKYTCITEDNNGQLLIGGNNKVFIIPDTLSNNILHYQDPELIIDISKIHCININSEQGYPTDNIKSIKDLKFDNFGNIWAIIDNKTGRVFISDSSTNKSEAVFKTLSATQNARVINIDEKGSLWIACTEELVQIIPAKDTFDLNRITYQNNIYDVDQFSENSSSGAKLWLGNNYKTILLFDPELNSFFPLSFPSDETDDLHDKSISCFLSTRSGVVFIGTAWGGLFTFNPNNLLTWYHPDLQNIHLDKPANLRFMLEDSKGGIWMIVKDIYHCDRYTGEIIETYSSEDFGLPLVYCNKMIEDRKGKLWIAMEGQGLIKMDPNNNWNRSVNGVAPFIHVLEKGDVTSIYEDPNGYIWAGIVKYNPGEKSDYSSLVKIDPEGRIVASYPMLKINPNKHRLLNRYINQIIIDEEGLIWMACGFGLVSFDENNEESAFYGYPVYDTSSAEGYRMLTLCPDPVEPRKYLWVGSAGGGLLCFNKHTRTFETFASKLPVLNANVNSILESDDSCIWVATNNLILRVQIDSMGGKPKNYSVFNKSNGLVTANFSNFYGHNAVITPNNELIFTGPKGFHIINPHKLSPDHYLPPVYITDLNINYKPANYGQPYSPLDKPIEFTKSIRLPHDQNTIEFQLTAPVYQSPGHLNYQYKLENYDKEWISNGDNRIITYKQIPPGNYKLKVRLENNSSVKGKPFEGPAIQIMRPWWLSIVAISVYVVIFLLLTFFIIRVITMRQKAKMKIRMNEMESIRLKELDSMKSKFFANISHELRTPLTLIINPLEDLLRENKNKEAVEKIKLGISNARKLQSYIDQLLDLSKIDANKLELKRKSYDVVKHTRYCLAAFESLAKYKNITIDLSSSSQQIKAFLDPSKYNIIITNLISNSLKFTPENGRIEIKLSVCNNSKHENCKIEAGYLEITVKDNGIGIPEDRLPYIFDRYFQASDKSENHTNGTGLGLAIVKELVRLHDGTIEAESKPFEFTMFKIRIPRNPNETCDFEILDELDNFTTDIEPISENIDLTPEQYNDDYDLNTEMKIILIIDDNKDMRTIIKKGLGKAYKVLEAEDGVSGSEVARKAIPDLILCDVMMPEKDGLELTRELKLDEITNHIPIVLLTAKADIESKVIGLQTGADDYLIKPFSSKELKIRIKNLLEQREKLKQKYIHYNIQSSKKDGTSSHGLEQAFLEKVIKVIKANLQNDDFNVNNLCAILEISRTQLYRKLNSLTDVSVSEMIRNTRLEYAAELLTKGSESISQIGFEVGYSSSQYFSRAFKEYYGCSPSEYRNMHEEP